jgi:hypothetical protein
MRSSEGAKAAVEAQQRAVKLEVLVMQLRRRVEQTGRRARFWGGHGLVHGVAHASMLVAFQTAARRLEATKAAVRKQPRATGSSSNGMAKGQADVDAKEAEFWEIIRHLQRRYQDGTAVASSEALKAEVAAHSPVRRAVRQVQKI